MPQKIRCVDFPGLHTEEVIDEINERMGEFGITRDNLISISAYPTVSTVPIRTGKEEGRPKVNVAVFFWSD